MEIPDEIKERIESTLKNDQTLRDRLLAGDEQAVKEIGITSQRGIPAKDIVSAFEMGNQEYIYRKAKHLKELERIYRILCGEKEKEPDDDR